MGNCCSLKTNIETWQFLRYDHVYLRIWCPRPDAPPTSNQEVSPIDCKIGKSRLLQMNQMLDGKLNKAFSVINIVSDYVAPQKSAGKAVHAFYNYSVTRRSLCLSMLNSLLRVSNNQAQVQKVYDIFERRLQMQRRKRPTLTFTFDRETKTYHRSINLASILLNSPILQCEKPYKVLPASFPIPYYPKRFYKSIRTVPRGYARE